MWVIIIIGNLGQDKQSDDNHNQVWLQIDDDENLGQGKPCECLGSDRGNFPGSEAVGTTRQDLNE